MKNLIEITNPSEMKRFVKENEYLLVDDGIEEFIIREEDLEDYIVNRNADIDVYRPDGTFLLSTFGFFLNKIDYSYRKKIIDRLVKLQTGELEPREIYFCDSIILDYM